MNIARLPTQNQPIVYIILLNWNGWQNTAACLDSLKRLEYANYHVLMVDNGSSDDSVVHIRASHPGVTILETGRNLGYSGGCNVGIRRALEEDADYVWLLNNDTIVDPNALSAMVRTAEADTRVGAVGSVLYYLDNPERIQAWGGGRVFFWTGRSRHILNPVHGAGPHYLTGTSILLRRHALDDTGLLDEKTFFMYWEDVDFSFRLRKAGWRLAVADKSIVLHREHAATGKHSPLLDYYYSESAALFFRRYAPIPAWPIFIGVLGRLAKRGFRGNLPGFVATLRGSFAGLRKG
ncbi:glycosyltransferase family 2 protein [Acidithiobacillus caldus]